MNPNSRTEGQDRMMEADKQLVWGGMGAVESAWGEQDGYRRKLFGGKTGNLEGAEIGVGWGG